MKFAHARSRPIEAALCKTTFQFFTIAVAFYCGIYRLPVSFATWRAPVVYNPLPDKVCFRPIGLRDRILPPSLARIDYFGLTLDGHPLEVGKCLLPDDGFTACVGFKAPVHANGYFFETAGSPDTDPVSWSVEAKSGNESQTIWRTIGASTWLIQFTGKHYFFPNLPYSTPLERGAGVAVTISPPWQWSVAWLSTQGIQYLGTVALAAAGFTGRAKWGRMIMIVTLLSIATILLITGAGYQIEHRYRDALSDFASTIPPTVLAIGVTFWESKILKVLSASAAAFILVISFKFTLLFPDPTVLITTLLFGLSTWLLILVFIGIYLRRKAVAAAQRLVAADTAAYDSLWDNLVHDSRSQTSLVNLVLAVHLLKSRAHNVIGAPRQYRRKASSESSDYSTWHLCMTESFLVGGGIPASIDFAKKICSLDQLFVQAEILDPIFLAKVKEWALVSSGCFPALQPKEGGVLLVRWGKAIDSKLQIRWGKLKSVTRAVEKLVRSYDQVFACDLVCSLRSDIESC